MTTEDGPPPQPPGRCGPTPNTTWGRALRQPPPDHRGGVPGARALGGDGHPHRRRRQPPRMLLEAERAASRPTRPNRTWRATRTTSRRPSPCRSDGGRTSGYAASSMRSPASHRRPSTRPLHVKILTGRQNLQQVLRQPVSACLREDAGHRRAADPPASRTRRHAPGAGTGPSGRASPAICSSGRPGG